MTTLPLQNYLPHILSHRLAGHVTRLSTCAVQPSILIAQFPMQEVGEVELNRNPEDYHRDVEQAAFSPGSLVPGIELSPDTLLNWRAFL
jgi:hypothetical protein